MKNLRQKIGYFFLNRRKKHLNRNRQVQNFKSAKNIGILFYIHKNNQQDIDKILDFLLFLKKENLNTKALAYINKKNIPYQFFNNKGMLYFCRKDLNIFEQPKKNAVSPFINEEFDVLIDLNIEGVFPLRYVSSLSKAKFKVGKYFHHLNGHDMMLNIDMNNTLDYMIDQTKNYLTIINNYK
ncbi:MAG: DUF6913 domain-containing protein [Bacteroidota bacterium]